MSDPSLPNAASTLVDANGRTTPQFYNWFRLLARKVTDAQATATDAAAAAESATSTPPVSISPGDGIAVYGDATSGYIIAATGSSSTGGGAPLSIGEDEVYTVAANTQVLYHSPITLDGEIVVSGELIQVA